MALQFANFDLSPHFLRTIEELGFEQPTPIQESAIPALLDGSDVIGQAQTGTGKTAAYVLPLLQNIQPGIGMIQALVLTPTRELAIQVTNEISRMSRNTPVKVMTVYGGQSYDIQIRQLKRGVDIVVGTTGRIMDLMKKNLLNLSKVNYLVLDEADEMLKMGFIEDVQVILNVVPEDRQIALFSATLPKPVRKLADRYLKDPQEIIINPIRLTVDETEQRFYFVKKDKKLAALRRLLEVEDISSALIFARTKAGVQELADSLVSQGLQVEAMHGDLTQSRRESVLNRFRKHIVSIIVATDVAARGLDIEDVSHVINFDVPENPDDYVHRIGRTGRAGHKGIAITFLTPRQKNLLKDIESYTKQSVQECKLPTQEEIFTLRNQQFIDRLNEQINTGDMKHERSLIQQLIDDERNLVEIAAAAIKLARLGEIELSTDENLEPAVHNYNVEHAQQRKTSKMSKRQANDGYKKNSSKRAGSLNHSGEPGMVRLRMNLGRNNGLQPRDVVGAIANEVGIPGHAIGEIDICKDYTMIDVLEKHMARVLSESNGRYLLRGKPVKIKLAEREKTYGDMLMSQPARHKKANSVPAL